MEILEHPRRQAVLRALVRDYIQTREPVGSKALVNRYALGVSSATVRNDMAALEEAGYIYQPHTSAGRVPTHAGYRAFVNQIDHLSPLSSSQKRAIKTFLTEPVELDEIMRRTVRLLAQMTQQAAVIHYPAPRVSRIQHIELVNLAAGRILCVVITDAGEVQQKMVALGEDLQSGEMALLTSAVNEAFSDYSAAENQNPRQKMLLHLPQQLHPVAVTLADALENSFTAERTNQVAYAGISNLARSQHEIAGDITKIIDALEEHATLVTLFTEHYRDGQLHVSIGAENHDDALTEVSVIAAGYGNESPGAQVGVIGPVRMDYLKSMSAVHTVARYLSKILGTTS